MQYAKKIKTAAVTIFFWLLYKYNKCLLELHVQMYITPSDFPKLQVYPNIHVQLMVGLIIS